MLSWHGNDSRITGPLWWESTGDQWIPLQCVCNVELWWFLCGQSEQACEHLPLVKWNYKLGTNTYWMIMLRFFCALLTLRVMTLSDQYLSALKANTTERISPSSHVSLALQWRHNGHNGVSNHQPHGCLLSRLFGRRSKKTSKLRVTGLCAGNSPGTGEFPAQMASNAENVFIWWRHHGKLNRIEG